MMIDNYKVLVITYDFYPDNSPNTYRWLNVLKEWKHRGVEVFILSGVKNQLPNYEEIDGIKIYRTGESFIGNLKYGYNENVSKSTSVKSARSNLFKTLAVKIVKTIYNFTWSKLYWPDYAFLWRRSAVKQAEKIITSENIDKIISVSWPFTSHLIAADLKKMFPHLYWMADSIDPFCFNDMVNNASIYKSLNERTEKKIFFSADRLSVLTGNIKQKYCSMFKGLEEKMMINHNIFIPNDFDYTKFDSNNNSLRCVFIGTLHEAVRSPKYLLTIFSRLILHESSRKLELHFYGDVTNSLVAFEPYAKLIDKSIFIHGKKDKSEINQILKQADVLINIGNNNEFQEPSKVIEYMYTGKKIINVCSIDNDSSNALLKLYPAKISVFPHDLDSNQILESIFEFVNTDQVIEKEYLDKILKPYYLDTVQNNYFNYLWSDKKIR